MTAAIQAAQDGATNVVVLEKMPQTGGNTIRTTGGMNAAATELQSKEGIEDSVELMVEDTMKGGKDLNDTELVKPKRMRVRKDRMLNSARLTCDYLGLKKGDKALLCMPLRYIAGKMMVVRSLYAGLDLEVREPSGHPLADWGDTPLRFAAMIPLQVYNTLRVPEERKRLEQTDILIIGGGAIDAALEQEIRQMPNTVYSTYGMTETLSHIALRRLNGPEASPYYHPFPSVTLSLSPENTLVIDAPLVCDERLVTNDVARLLPDGSFAIIGRKDNIINSGGIKIQIEEVEERLRPYLDRPYAITAAPDPRLGEARGFY